ncbi:MAG: hypothetical protein WA837_20680, partial [Xanthobacteraceae bacterium]
MSFETRDAVDPKLPLWNTIYRAYATWLSNPLDVLRISWLWLALAILTSLVEWSSISGTVADAGRESRPHIPIEISVFVGLSNFFLMLSPFSIAVAWHRRIILDEQPRFSGSNVFTKSLWYYIGAGILITLTAWLPIVLIFLITAVFSMLLKVAGTQLGPLGFVFLIPLILVFYLMSITIVLRLSLLLPARAVGDFGRTFKETWRRTRGNTWRIFWGFLACTLPTTIV